MIGFIFADLRRHWAGVLAVILLVALSTALGVVVTLQERALRLGSARAADAFDLVIGAPGSETQLVLSSVFLQASPLPLLPGSVLARLAADPRVAWAAPVGFGDFVQGYPIVGTTPALVSGLGDVGEGTSFARVGDAILGAHVALRVGDTFHPAHGQAEAAGGMHTEASYTVVGRLKPTGTPWDRAVLVPIEAVWSLHDHHNEPAQETAASGAFFRPPADPGHEDHDFAAPIRPEAISDPDAPGVPAIVVKPRTIADAYKLRQQYRADRTVAVFPAEVLTRLYGTLGDVRLVLAWVAAGAQGLVGAAIFLVVTIHLLQRRRQIGALRAFGAPRVAIFGIVWLEAFVIIAIGTSAGFAIGYGAAASLSATFAKMSGVPLPVFFDLGDLYRFVILLGFTGLVAGLPAILAYRQSPAEALRN